MASKYELRPGETPEQYKIRNNVNTITPSPTKGTGGSPTDTGTGTGTSDALYAAMTKRLLDQADVVSSLDTNLESTFNQAISGIQGAADKNKQRIESQFGREIGYAQDTADSQFTDFADSRSGFGTQMVAFRNLVQTTDKHLKDLEMRKEELILQGDATAASEIAKMQIEKLQFRQQAEQQVFSNLLGLGNFAIQGRQASLAEQRFGLDQQQFGLQQQSFGLQQSTQAFNQIAKFQDMGLLGSLDATTQSELEMNAGLPAGVIKAMASIPPQQEIRAVGDQILSIDPRTGAVKVIYSGGGKDAGGVSLGTGTNVSWMTASVMNGMQKLNDLTPTQQSTVLSEMNKAGFGSEEPPAWYVKQMRDANSVVSDATIRGHWGQWRQSFVVGKQFLNREFLEQAYPDASTKELDGLESTVRAWKSAEFTDEQIAEILNLK